MDFETDDHSAHQIYGVALVGTLVVPTLSDLRGERAFHIAVPSLFGALCFALVVAIDNLTVKYVFLCFGVGTIYATAPIILVYTSNLLSSPADKRAVAGAFVIAAGNSASIAGSFMWPLSDAPRYVPGFSATTAFLVVLCLTAVAVHFLNKRYPPYAPARPTQQDRTYNEDTEAKAQVDHVE